MSSYYDPSDGKLKNLESYDGRLPVSSGIMGLVTAVAAQGLTDATKDFETDIVKDKIIRIVLDGKSYLRKITAAAGALLSFPILRAEIAAVAASVTVEGAGSAKISAVDEGEAGNDLLVEIIAGTGNDQALAAAYDAEAKKLTISSATDAGGVAQAVLAQGLAALFAGVPAVAAVFAVSDVSNGALDLTDDPLPLIGGADVIPALTAPVGTPYEVML